MEHALLVIVDFRKKDDWPIEDVKAELEALAASSGVEVFDSIVCKRDVPTPALFIGKGKAEEIARKVQAEDIDVVIFNDDLSGNQKRNLEELIDAKIIDRTQLILDIFAQRAKSNEGKVQVELAQLLYLSTRLTGRGVELSRLGGGVGTRGPGEQKLEMDRRRIKARISRLKDELDTLKNRRDALRQRRTRRQIVSCAIIGYTNAGKSTLLNSLTGSMIHVENRLFSTLDPTTRRLILPNKEVVLLTDTVGFLHNLPHHLIDAFKATLEEVINADCLLHILDVSHPMASQQNDVVHRVLGELGCANKPIVTLLNKIDRLQDEFTISKFMRVFEDALPISALKGMGFDALYSRLERAGSNLNYVPSDAPIVCKHFT